VSAAEKGRRAFTLADLTAVAAALEVSTASLLPDSLNNTPRRKLEADLAEAEQNLGDALVKCAELRSCVNSLRAQLDHYDKENSDA